MADTTIDRLVRELNEKNVQSVYLDRLRDRAAATGNAMLAQAALEVELRQEVAESLGRAEDKINHSLLDLELLGHALDDGSVPGAQRAAAIQRFNARRDDAVRFREYLLIQREALGFRGNEVLERLYPIPPRR